MALNIDVPPWSKGWGVTHFATTLAVTPSIDPVKVLVDGHTNRVLNVKIIHAERDALFCQEALGYASIRTLSIVNISFDDTIHPFKRHHAVQEHRPELDDILHDMDQQMYHNVEQCGW
jgi:hypothetical protein